MLDGKDASDVGGGEAVDGERDEAGMTACVGPAGDGPHPGEFAQQPEDGTTPAPGTPPELASAQRKLKLMQWVVPATTGALLAVSSYAGEQQRASEVVKGSRGPLSVLRS